MNLLQQRLRADTLRIYGFRHISFYRGGILARCNDIAGARLCAGIILMRRDKVNMRDT